MISSQDSPGTYAIRPRTQQEFFVALRFSDRQGLALYSIDLENDGELRSTPFGPFDESKKRMRQIRLEDDEETMKLVQADGKELLLSIYDTVPLRENVETAHAGAS